jgi:alpha-N-arabinofuranosidase
MLTAALSFDPAFVVGVVGRRLFGSFVEHMGRCVYSGIFEPGHPGADEEGFRGDVLALTRELGVSVVRYPGGNFVSGYRWEDSVGPVGLRPRRLELAWHSVESNEFGLGEFMRWAAKAGVEPMMAVNLGTRGVAEALDVLEYVNFPGGTALSDLRVAHGAVDPFGVRMWCLGNEMDGPWQIGHKTAAEYGRLAAETGKAMRMVDPGLELVACGSSSSSMPTFGSWESTVLELAYDQVDYISAHAYYEPFGDDLDSFLASGVDLDHFIESVVATADAVRARLGRSKRINLSFDEWNVWKEKGDRAPGPPSTWAIQPRISEEVYDVVDAVVVGSMLISLLRRCDRVTAACISLLTNVSAPIRSEPGGPAWRQTIFHPFALTARHARGEVLRVRIDSPTMATQRHGEVPVVDAVATVQAEEISLFLVNRHRHEPVSVRVATGGFGEVELVEELTVSDADLGATNTAEHPDRVVPRNLGITTVDDHVLGAELPPASWTVITLRGRPPHPAGSVWNR